MKIRLSYDEMYPVFYFGNYGRSVEITKTQHKRYQKIRIAFEDLQEELEEIFDNALDTTQRYNFDEN